MQSTFAPGAICGPVRLGKELLNDQDLSMVAPQHMDLVYLATERVHAESKGKIIPTVDQLLCLIALQEKDVLYIAATGSGYNSNVPSC